MFDVPLDADEETVIVALDQFVEQNLLSTKLGDITASLGLTPDVDDAVILARIDALAKNAATAVDSAAASLVNDAVAAGKITPAQSGWALDLCRRAPESFNAYLVNSRTVVPLGGLITIDPPIQQNTEASLTDTERSICKTLGLDEADYIRFNC